MAKRKDTQRYAALVSDYCSCRGSYNFNKRRLDEHFADLGKANNHHDSISVDDEVEKWYHGYVSMLNTLIDFEKSSVAHLEEKMKAYGSELETDYEENLDILYALKKEKWQE